MGMILADVGVRSSLSPQRGTRVPYQYGIPPDIDYRCNCVLL